MPSLPHERLEEAKRYFDRASSDEAQRRTTISRAYLATFVRLTEIADKLPAPPVVAGGVHERVVRTLQCCPGHAPFGAVRTECRRASHILNQFRSLRTDADYQTNIDITVADAELALKLASQIFEIADEIEKKIK